MSWPRASARVTAALAALTWPLLMLACGGDAKRAAAPSPSAEGSAPTSPTSRATGLPGALAGRWEIVRFESKATVPPEAQAIFAQMFDTLRLELRPDGTASVTLGKTTTPASWSVEGSAESFTFRMRDGLLDGAKCRVTGDREWEAFEASGSWPGTSRLRRLD